MVSRGYCRFCGREDRCFSSGRCGQHADLADDSTGSGDGLCESRQNDDGAFLFLIGKGTFSKKDIDHVRIVCLVFAHLRLQTNEKVTIQKEIL